LEGISSLKVAVQRTKAIKVIQESNFEGQKDFSFRKDGKRVNNFNKNKKENSEEISIIKKKEIQERDSILIEEGDSVDKKNAGSAERQATFGRSFPL